MLSQSKVTDNALDQTINILLDWLDQLEVRKADIINNINNSINTITSIVTFLTNNTATYLTSADESLALVNSRQVLPGTNITFDDSVPNKRVIHSTVVSGSDLDYLGDYVPGQVYNDGDIVVGPDGITYMCTKDGINTPPEPWPGGSGSLHHTTHEPGGGDPLEVDAIPTRGSLRTLGSGPNQAIPGNAGVAWLALNNVFTGNIQTIQAVNPMLNLVDNNQPAEARIFRIFNGFQTFRFDALNDAQTLVQATPLALNRVGDAYIGRDIYEKGRTIPIGHWQSYTPIWSGPSGTAPSIGNGTLLGSYAVVGRTCHFRIGLEFGSTTNQGTVAYYQWTLPFNVVSISGGSFGPVITVGYRNNAGGIGPAGSGYCGVGSNVFYAVAPSGALFGPNSPVGWTPVAAITIDGTFQF